MRYGRLIFLGLLWPLLAAAEVDSAVESQIVLGALITPSGAINTEFESAGILMLYTPGGSTGSSGGSGTTRPIHGNDLGFTTN